MSLFKRSVTEGLGTFWLVLGGCGSAVLAAAFPAVGIGFLGVLMRSMKAGGPSVCAALRHVRTRLL